MFVYESCEVFVLFLKDYSYRMSLVITERTGQLQEIRKQLSLREQELCKLKQDKDFGLETDHLKSLLKEKESLIKVQLLHIINFDSV